MIGVAHTPAGVVNKLNGSLQSVVIWPVCRQANDDVDDQTNEIMKDMNQLVTPSSGVSAWFNFMQYTPADISGNNIPAQLYGSLTPVVETPCLQVPGPSVPGYGDCGAPDSMNFTGAQPFTLEAWVYPQNGSGGGIISKISNGSGPMYQLSINGSGAPIFAAYNSSKGTSTTLLPTNPLPVNQWSHIAGTYDGNNNLKLYVNGQQVSASPFILGGAPPSPAQHTMIGAGFTGYIAYARIWAVCRTSQEITDNINSNVLNVPGIIANYDFATMSAYLPPTLTIYDQSKATTRSDLTTQNTLSMIGSANVVFFDQSVSNSVAQSMSPVSGIGGTVATTPVQITPEMAQALTAAIGGKAPGSDQQRKEAVSNDKLQELILEFDAVLPTNLSAPDLQARQAKFQQNLQALFAKAKSNPDAVRGKIYAKWASRGNKRVLTLYLPKGKVDLAEANSGLLESANRMVG